MKKNILLLHLFLLTTAAAIFTATAVARLSPKDEPPAPTLATMP